jgi:hypothetical protein
MSVVGILFIAMIVIFLPATIIGLIAHFAFNQDFGEYFGLSLIVYMGLAFLISLSFIVSYGLYKCCKYHNEQISEFKHKRNMIISDNDKNNQNKNNQNNSDEEFDLP